MNERVEKGGLDVNISKIGQVELSDQLVCLGLS